MSSTTFAEVWFSIDLFRKLYMCAIVWLISCLKLQNYLIKDHLKILSLAINYIICLYQNIHNCKLCFGALFCHN